MTPAQNIQQVRRLLPPGVQMVLRQLVPVYQERARYARDAQSLERAAVSVVRFRFGKSSPEEVDLLALCLMDMASGVAAAADTKDAMGALGDEQQMLMQQLLERRAKSLSTLSNLMKKQSDTANSIISNLK